MTVSTRPPARLYYVRLLDGSAEFVTSSRNLKYLPRPENHPQHLRWNRVRILAGRHREQLADVLHGIT